MQKYFPASEGGRRAYRIGKFGMTIEVLGLVLMLMARLSPGPEMGVPIGNIGTGMLAFSMLALGLLAGVVACAIGMSAIIRKKDRSPLLIAMLALVLVIPLALVVSIFGGLWNRTDPRQAAPALDTDGRPIGSAGYVVTTRATVNAQGWETLDFLGNGQLVRQEIRHRHILEIREYDASGAVSEVGFRPIEPLPEQGAVEEEDKVDRQLVGTIRLNGVVRFRTTLNYDTQEETAIYFYASGQELERLNWNPKAPR